MKKTVLILLTGILTGLLLVFSGTVMARPPQRTPRQFRELPENHPARIKIDDLQKRGVVSQTRRGDLRLYENVTRGEVANMIHQYDASFLDTDNNTVGYLIDLFCFKHAASEFPNGGGGTTLRSKYNTICNGRQ